jgi:hypothetical protein
MKKTTNSLILTILVFTCEQAFSQTYPTFGDEIPVNIIGLNFDAMEPSVSADGNMLFFNSLNDGITTGLYYAIKVNDSTFTYIASLSGANQTIAPRLDAVASSDSANHFFWVSTRDYPTQFDNYYHGTFNGTDIMDIGRLHGTFYIYSPGWLIMDAAINYDGTYLYYCNAYFNDCGSLPCIAKLGIAQKQNDSTFNKLNNSDSIFKNINDTNYIVYAPNVTKDGLELYYTRLIKSNPTQTEICVAVRATMTDTFSSPSIIYASINIPEAPTLSTDQSKMYYHKKEGSLYKIFLRYRTSTTEINEALTTKGLAFYPNPSNNILKVNLPYPNQNYYIEIYSQLGQLLIKTSDRTVLDISDFTNGIYILIIKQDDKIWTSKILKQ